MLYLDTDIAGNHQDDRQISQTLYGGDHAYRLRQEWILGTAGVKMLRAGGSAIAAAGVLLAGQLLLG